MLSIAETTRPRPTTAANTAAWSTYALCAIAVLYPFEGFLGVFRNLTGPDVLLCMWVVVALFDHGFREGLSSSCRTLYGATACFGVAWIFLSALVTDQQLENGLAAAQLAFVYLVFVPCVAYGFARTDRPETYVHAICGVFSLCYAIAFVLLMMGVSTGIVSDEGSQRIFPIWNEDAAYRIAVLHAALILGRLATGRGRLLPSAIEFLLPAIVVMGIASRTSLLGIGGAGAVSVLIAMTPRYFPRAGGYAMAVVALLAFAVVFLALGADLPMLDGLPVRTSRLTEHLFDDGTRIHLITDRLGDLESTRNLLFGTGPAGEAHDVAVHCVFVQYAVDCGLPAAVLMLLAWCAPMAMCLQGGRLSERTILAVVAYVSQLPFLLFMPVLTNASPYLPLAFILALVLRETAFRDASEREHACHALAPT